ncbi:Hpt domain-containing protein, partial [Pyxidicoccus sp. 3LG]
MTMDMSRYLGLFISEASEHLEALGRDLVQLERESSAGAVDSMFRHAHSVKGMASSMGFESIAILAHRVEDLVDAVRQDRGRLDRDLVDLLLTSADTMLAQVRAVAENKPPDDASSLLAQLGARVTSMTGQALAATRVAKVTALKQGGGSGEAAPEQAAGSASSGPGDTGGTASASGGTGTVASARSSGVVGVAGASVDAGSLGSTLPPHLLTPREAPTGAPSTAAPSDEPSRGRLAAVAVGDG